MSESKKQKLRNNEYYNIQYTLDSLFQKSKEGYNFYKLYELIIKEENILLAYRNLKKNSGSKTKGTDNKTIKYLEQLSNNDLITLKGNMHTALRRTELKEMHVVRYADDFKIFCSTENEASKIFIATKNWIKDRLNLEVSEEKSRVVNLEKECSEFLGIKFKLIKNKDKWTIRSEICDKAKNRMVSDIKHQLKKIKKYVYPPYVQQLNSMIIGYHQYYSMATMVCEEFREIQNRVFKKMDTKFAKTEDGFTPAYFNKMYGKYKGKTIYLHNIRVVPIWGIRFRKPMQLTKGICNYTEDGRSKIHKKPIELGGTDEYNNLIYIHRDIHKLIHATAKETIEKYLNKISLNKEQVNKINNLRKLAELEMIQL